MKQFLAILLTLVFGLVNQQVYAACGATTITFTGNTNNDWDNAGNWSPANAPDNSTENALIISGARSTFATQATIGCLEIAGGRYRTNATYSAGETLTITGDYFKNLIPNTMTFRNADDFVIDMAGTAEQDFEAVDNVTRLDISNNTVVNITQPGRVVERLRFLASSGTVNIQGQGEWKTDGTDITIPSGVTVVIANGATWYSTRNITVDGVLKIQGGGTLRMGNGDRLTVNGVLQMNGSSGNVATIKSDGGNRFFYMDIYGSMSANYFRIDGLRNSGVYVRAGGTISSMDNGEFHNGRSGVDYIRVAGTATMPATMDNIGFYDDYGYGNLLNVNAAAYSGSNVNFTNYSGGIGGPANESDANNVIDWGTVAATKLSLTSDTPANQPGNTSRATDGEKVFAILAAALTDNDTSTDITSITVTLEGTASASDLEYIRLYQDTNGNCNYNAGTDTQIGSDLSLSGVPAQATFSVPATTLSTSGPADKACFIITSKVSDIGEDGKTVKLGVEATSDMVNSQNYDFSDASGPPVYGNQTTIIGSTQSRWDGSSSNVWTVNNNWIGQAPTAGNNLNCFIGQGLNVTGVTSNPVYCQNAELDALGTMDFLSGANTFAVTGSLTVDSGFTFSNAGSGIISMQGSVSQGLALGQAFPGNLDINNSGGAGNNLIQLTSDSTVNGNITVTNGVLDISSGTTLTVLGDLTVSTGAELRIENNGTLVMGNNSTLTINSGGLLTIVGSSGSPATVTSQGGANSYNVIINGTIAANYYAFKYINASGVSIESGATIDATNHLQNGSFIHPEGTTPTMLFLKTQVPGNTLNNMVFDLNGSSSTGITNINTTGSAAGTLTVNTYSGNLAGASYDTDPSYNINWVGATNTLNLTKEISSPATVNQGLTYNMGRFGLQQTLAGASYSDTDVTSLTLTMTGTGSAVDVNEVRVYFDSDCDSAAGTLVGTSTFSGNPAKASFSFSGGQVTIPANTTTTEMRCLYIEYDIDSLATAGATVGVEISSSTDLVNSQSYELSAATPAPVNLNPPATIVAVTQTIWTGNTSTDWFTATNWTSGVPSSTVSCIINNQANDPVIGSGTASCKNMTISTGDLTIAGGATLDIYGNLDNDNVLTTTGTLRMFATVATNQSIASVSTLGNLTVQKTGGAALISASDLTINSLTLPSGGSFVFYMTNGKNLTLPNGVDIQGGTLQVQSGSIVYVGNGQNITVSGGNFTMNGTADSWQQNPSNKAKVEVQGGTGSYGFNATSGNVYLKGFNFDKIDTNGVRINGSTNLLHLEGGQLSNLSTSYASVRGFQLNTSGSIPATADKIYWTWGTYNSEGTDANSDGIPDAPTPANTESYLLASSSGCGGLSIDFTNIGGDWLESSSTFDIDTKKSATSCTINFASVESAVSLLSLTATPYNGAVDIRWVTKFELDHMGFNVFRANEDGSEFVRINDTLLMNFNTSGAFQGSYRFIDRDVTNGEQYFYYIQDVEIDGVTTEMHGPVVATPLASLGAPPADETDQNSGENPDDGDPTTTDPGTISNPSFKDLGDGIAILSQTSTSLRIQIEPSAASYSASAWDGSYEDISITGFNKTLTAGHPELPVRDLLIEVHRFATTASLTNATITDATVAGKNISPAPSWSADGSGVLQPSYAEDATAYASNALAPASHYDLTTNLIRVSGRTFLKLRVYPMRYNPVSDDIQSASKIVLDIGLDGDAWEVDPPSFGDDLLPGLVSNTLRIYYTATGMYELEYDDIVDSNVEGPFSGIDPAELRLFKNSTEVKFHVLDENSNSSFDSGDKIRFYAEFVDSLDSNDNMMTLATEDILSSSTAVKRMDNLDGTLQVNLDTNDLSVWKTKTYEQNDLFFTEVPIGDDGDHFFWARLFSFAGIDTLDFTAALPELDTESEDPVEVKVYIVSRDSHQGNEVTHNLQLFVNDMSEPMAQKIFDDRDRVTLTFNIDAVDFSQGNNSIRLKATGDFVPSGDYEVLYIDKVEFNYKGQNVASSGKLHIKEVDNEWNLEATDFTSNAINVYDVTDSANVSRISNGTVTTDDGGTTYDISFYANPGDLDQSESEYQMVQDGSFLTPSQLALTNGYGETIKDSTHQADMIIIGSETLINTGYDLVSHREGQGLVVKSVTLDQIYVEFNNGIKSAKAIQDFVQYTQNSWTKPAPKYLLLLGDATYNPRGHVVDNFDGDPIAANDRASGQDSTFPLRNDDGMFWDFGDDNYFVSNSSTYLPSLAVGRIPTNNPDTLSKYIEKLIAWENGDSVPEEAKTALFISDEDQDYEKFESRADSLATLGSWGSADFTVSTLHYADAGNDMAMATQITAAFNDPKLLMTFLGHGATDLWGYNGYLENSDMSGLTNDKHPIVMGLNCDNAYFYDEDLNKDSIGETMVFNENGGAIAFIGATTYTTPPAQQKLAQAFYEQMGTSLAKSVHDIRLGTLLQRAKVALGEDAYTKDIVRAMTLIGDPAMKFPDSAFSPEPPQRPAESSKAGGSGGGCSAGANDGTQGPWYSGLVEWLIVWLGFFWLIFISRKCKGLFYK